MTYRAGTAVTLREVQKNAQGDVVFYDPACEPFCVHGVMTPDETENYYRRMPGDTAEKISETTVLLFSDTAGGRIRFCTDSKHLHIKAFFPGFTTMAHFAQSGISGFSVYIRKNGGQDVFGGIFFTGENNVSEGSTDLQTEEMKEITIYLPLYNKLDKVFIGLDKTAKVEPASAYGFEKPVVFYGSSITQGGCASRPGSDYEAVLSRRLNFDYVNLGFSGGARGETAMAEYIKTLPMQAFVMDYDHNAPSPEHLEKTHERFFGIIRDACPQLPVILVSRPDPYKGEDNRKRFEIIKRTYENALGNGDRNVYLIDGADFFKDALEYNDPTVDLVHPTDFGFCLMAKGIEPFLREALYGKK